jgi:hypothetical protein
VLPLQEQERREVAAIPRRIEELKKLLAGQEALQEDLQRRYKMLSRVASSLKADRVNVRTA